MSNAVTYAETQSDSDIDDGTCTKCNCTVTYDEASQDDEVCIRTKPYCTKHVDEHVDWRATCKHVEACLAAMTAARDRIYLIAKGTFALHRMTPELAAELDALSKVGGL